MAWIFSDVDSLIEHAPHDVEVAAAMHHVLERHYPGHQWATSADHRTGMAHVKLLYLDAKGINGRYGFQLHLTQLNSDPRLQCVVRAGGELLERYRLKRGPATADSKALARQHGLDITL